MAIQLARYRKVHPDALTPQYHTDLAAGFDLACVEDIKINWGDSPKLVRTGLVIAAPLHHMLYITFRSSTPRKWGITVLEGIVDADYCGDEDELHIQVSPLRHHPFTVPAGTRIAQGVFIPVTRGAFIKVNEMGKSRGGFGSTG